MTFLFETLALMYYLDMRQAEVKFLNIFQKGR